MGTQAYWMRSPWRYRLLDQDGDPGPWLHARTLEDIRADLPPRSRAEVWKYDRRAEEYKPNRVMTTR